MATEVTVIASGHVVMNGVEYRRGDIAVLEPGESADFHVVEDAITVVVKMPSVKGDKYPPDHDHSFQGGVLHKS